MNQNVEQDTAKGKHFHVSSTFDVPILAKLILKIFAFTWTDLDFINENDQRRNQFKSSVVNAFLHVGSFTSQISNSENDDYYCFFANPLNTIQPDTALLFLKEVVTMNDLTITSRVIRFLFLLSFDFANPNHNCKEDIFVELCTISLKVLLSKNEYNHETCVAMRNVLHKISSLSSNFRKKLELNQVLAQSVSLSWVGSHYTSADREAWKRCMLALCR